MKTNNLTVLSLDELSAFPVGELKRQLELVSAIQDILNEELKLWTKRLNSYSIYETSDRLDNDTVSLIIAAGALIKQLKEILRDIKPIVDTYTEALEITKEIKKQNDETLQSIFE